MIEPKRSHSCDELSGGISTNVSHDLRQLSNNNGYRSPTIEDNYIYPREPGQNLTGREVSRPDFVGRHSNRQQRETVSPPHSSYDLR